MSFLSACQGSYDTQPKRIVRGCVQQDCKYRHYGWRTYRKSFDVGNKLCFTVCSLSRELHTLGVLEIDMGTVAVCPLFRRMVALVGTLEVSVRRRARAQSHPRAGRRAADTSAKTDQSKNRTMKTGGC